MSDSKTGHKLSYYRKKYPKSRTNKQCIGPCYPAKTRVIHPITVRYVTHFDEPFCPTHRQVDDKTQEETWLDTCYNVTETEQDLKEVKKNALSPSLAFNCEHFLRLYYKIDSMEDCLEWIDNHPSVSYYTKNRLINCAWGAYGEHLGEAITPIITFYLTMAKKRWMPYILQQLNRYLKIEGESIKFGKQKKPTEPDYLRIEKINFIVDRLINFHTLQQFLNKYIAENKGKWNETDEHTRIIKKRYSKFLEGVIHETIKS